MKPGKPADQRPVEVQCYSGYKADERPVSFRIGDEKRVVENIVDQWHGEDHAYFKVLADDSLVYLLRHDRDRDSWTVVDVKERVGRH
ncbi:MAG: hypothetical protein AB1640_03760 [bacterium]